MVASKGWGWVRAPGSADEQKNAGELHQLDRRERARFSAKRHPEFVGRIHVLRTENVVSGSDAVGVGSGELRRQWKYRAQHKNDDKYGFHSRRIISQRSWK